MDDIARRSPAEAGRAARLAIRSGAHTGSTAGLAPGNVPGKMLVTDLRHPAS